MAAAWDERGRRAHSPDEIPALGWRDILIRVHKHVTRERLGIVAAGIAFYALMALFPGMIALLGIYGMLYSPDEASRQIGLLAGLLPPRAYELFTAQMDEIIELNRLTMRIGSALAVLLALWAASSGMRALMNALNMAYHEETGPLLRFYGKSMVFTAGALLCAVATLALVFGVPIWLRHAGVAEPYYSIGFYGRWLVLAGGTLVALAVLYRYGPSRRKAQWQWVSWGAAFATGLWIIASALFYLYIVNFDRYNATYGSIAGVVIALTWFLITAWALVLGGEINAQMERQTEEDTTEGPSRPLGQRGARAADTVGSEH